jgi:acetyl-CoA synthetase
MEREDPTPNLSRFSSYEQAVREFEWKVPDQFNIADSVCCKFSDGATRAALIEVKPSANNLFTFGGLDYLSDKFANVLRSCGTGPGDRVAVILTQSAALAIAHLAALKLGCVVVPLTTLFGSAALQYRIKDSGASVAVVDQSVREVLNAIKPSLPDLKNVFVAEKDSAGETRSAHRNWPDFWDEVHGASSDFIRQRTLSSTPAYILYTSGSTGDAKGAVHSHGFLIGHLTAFEMLYNFDLGDDTVFWTPADWAWIGALFDAVFPAWYYGRPVVAHRAAKFNGAEAFSVLERCNVTCAFIPPTALRIMKRDVPSPRDHYRIGLRNILTGGEALTPEIHDWVRNSVGSSINEGYGQTEANMLVANCEKWFPAKHGSMGRPAPGHVVEILDDAGQVAAPGTEGRIAVRRPDPVMMLGYLNQPEKTADAVFGNWLITGDLGSKDEGGYLRFQSRNDDLIKTAAYRVGPTEVERVILQHNAVVECAVVGIPDELRGTIIKAFVRLGAAAQPCAALVLELQTAVQDQIGRHAYPREIEFVDLLPTTTTGKIKRKDLRDQEIEKRRAGVKP